MIRMLIVGYCFGIRSERRLCDEVHLNLAYRWFWLCPSAWCKSTARRELRCAVLSAPQRTAESEQYR
jgi:hypothetical protein